MNLNQALSYLFEGVKIKLPEWEGYWFLNKDFIGGEDGIISVRLGTGEVVNTPDFVQYGGREDWMVVPRPMSPTEAQ